MRVALAQTDRFLRGADVFAPSRVSACPWWWFPLLILGFASVYGGMMGTFHLDSVHRLRQVVFAGLKLPLLLLSISAVCIPAFFVLNTVLGLRDDFSAALRAILAGQAGLSVTLAALAPLTRLWYFSTPGYHSALQFNAAMFAVATVGGHLVMGRYYRRPILRRPYHRIALYAWLIMYAFVGMQMGWILRPFVGSPNAAVTFFRAEPFTNAYVVISRLIFGA